MVPVDTNSVVTELDLLSRREALYPPQRLKSALGAAAVHVVLLVIFLMLPAAPVRIYQDVRPQVVDYRKSTPLTAPVLPKENQQFEMTQKEPNKGKVQKEANLDSLLPRQQQASQNNAAPAPRKFVPPAPSAQTASPQLAVPDPIPPQLGNPDAQLPQIADPQLPTSAPKLAFEVPGSTSGVPAGAPRMTIPKPAAPTIEEAVRANLRGRATSGLVVTDIADLPTGAGATLSASPKRGQAGSTLELLSDPQGVDFKPYLIRVLASVRRNWFAVIPESVKFGQRGKVTIQFAINQRGSVPKLVIASPSGTDSLDRAAVAGISASNPFPPLPSEFKGEFIRLQLSFSYNMPSN